MAYLQLVYASGAMHPFSEQELLVLLEECRTNNTRIGVTGVLLYVGTSFLQVLEGEAEAVESLYERVAEDDRHGAVTLLLRRIVPVRGFGKWSMGFVNANRKGKEFDGLFDILRNRSFADLREDHKAVRSVLDGFVEGKWRKTIR